MRVLFVVPHPIEGPSSRFRVYQYIPYLEANGVECTVSPFVSSRNVQELYKDGNTLRKIGLTLGGLVRRGFDAIRARQYDIVFVLREAFALGPPFVEWSLTRAGKHMIYDFDDAIYMPALSYKNVIDHLRDFDKPAKVINMADTVITGSQYLANYAKNTTSGTVEVLPTVVDHSVYCPRNGNADTKEVTLGWIGTPRGSGYVADMMPVFQKLSARHPNLKMVFIGCAPFDTAGLPITFRDWALEREPSDIAEFDIGIMPLTDDEETRGKCGFKLIQYMSSGVAAIGSPVGANNDIIEDGVSGLLADHPSEWEAGLERLITDMPFRRKLSAAGRKRAIEHYSLQRTAPEMLRIFQDTINRQNR